MSTDKTPWYQRTLRWGQTNLTEIDPARYDSGFWRAYWRRTRVQGVLVNAGGVVAYYPSANPLHYRASGLGDRDLYGDVVRDAREEGLTVIARMDSSRTTEQFYRAHPGWFTRDAEGEPYTAGERYLPCVNSEYYSEYLPAIFREIIERSQPDGFSDTNWSGLKVNRICFCDNCACEFRVAAGADLPRTVDHGDPIYRNWLRWNERRRTEIWRRNSAITSAAGGEDCVWVGMLVADQAEAVRRFVNIREIAVDAKIFFVDHQRRNELDGFAHNAEAGARLHGVLGWDKLLPETMAMYSAGRGSFRATSMAQAEALTWAASAFAGGIQPWWHHIGAVHEDRRQYAIAEPLFRWHERNQQHLVGRRPVADVAVVWTEQNTRFHGGVDPDNIGVAPYRGVVKALTRARIAYIPVHLDDVPAVAGHVRAVVLPDIAVMTDAECQMVSELVDRSVSVVATGATGMKDPDGLVRANHGLGSLLGLTSTGSSRGSRAPHFFDIDDYSRHDYLRIDRAAVPAHGISKADVDAIFEGFDETDILPLGGRLECVRARGAATLATHVEAFPIYPPELAWLRPEPTSVPVLLARRTESGARVIYSAADVDRLAGRDSLPDHLQLVANIVRWAVGCDPVLEVEGPGLVDCRLYTASEELVLHLVNIMSTSPVPGTHDEPIHVGPFEARIRCGAAGAVTARALVADLELPSASEAGVVTVSVPVVGVHEVVVVTLN